MLKVKMGQYSGSDNLEVMLSALNYNQYLLNLISRFVGNSSKIVDFGAGIGTFAKAMRNNGYPVNCIEPDKLQSKIIENQGISVIPLLGSIGQNRVDYLYSLNVLEHIEDDQSILKEIYLSLVPGGHALIYVPAFEILFSSMDRKVGHFRRYTKKDLTEKLIKANFIIKKARYVDCLGFFASLAFRFLGNRSGAIGIRSVYIYDRIIFPISRLFDRFFQYFLGKNVWVLAQKPVN